MAVKRIVCVCHGGHAGSCPHERGKSRSERCHKSAVVELFGVRANIWMPFCGTCAAFYRTSLRLLRDDERALTAERRRALR